MSRELALNKLEPKALKQLAREQLVWLILEQQKYIKQQTTLQKSHSLVPYSLFPLIHNLCTSPI
ncbi:MAG: hypothetical protein F6J90_10070 [Moorea sp. SIOASIH]|uniref:hypothetical protein n=1 Tax=Moorena sp. SIOASIH TaxID=2607817 RepID=UPI0013B9A366|nr:hypothetical protein [Moorena sp. SIOASIH]NEO36650.1 hypothetical protein [Moorena sp. SIOASIH]NEO92391.1 hypothetical protein [Moorena sp. SIO3G5]